MPRHPRPRRWPTRARSTQSWGVAARCCSSRRRPARARAHRPAWMSAWASRQTRSGSSRGQLHHAAAPINAETAIDKLKRTRHARTRETPCSAACVDPNELVMLLRSILAAIDGRRAIQGGYSLNSQSTNANPSRSADDCTKCPVCPIEQPCRLSGDASRGFYGYTGLVPKA